MPFGPVLVSFRFPEREHAPSRNGIVHSVASSTLLDISQRRGIHVSSFRAVRIITKNSAAHQPHIVPTLVPGKEPKKKPKYHRLPTGSAIAIPEIDQARSRPPRPLRRASDDGLGSSVNINHHHHHNVQVRLCTFHHSQSSRDQTTRSTPGNPSHHRAQILGSGSSSLFSLLPTSSLSGVAREPERKKGRLKRSERRLCKSTPPPKSNDTCRTYMETCKKGNSTSCSPTKR
jgi:hypothetical protein